MTVIGFSTLFLASFSIAQLYKYNSIVLGQIIYYQLLNCKTMSDTRTYIVPDGQENSTNQMLPWMAMMNGGMGGFGNGMWNNPFMYLVWMWMMRWMNNGE